MAKKIGGYENYRVVIEPRPSWASTDERRNIRNRESCEDIKKDVERHVDNVGTVSVECDEIHVCSHCGSAWTETRDDYNGGCCDADQDAEDERNKK